MGNLGFPDAVIGDCGKLLQSGHFCYSYGRRHDMLDSFAVLLGDVQNHTLGMWCLAAFVICSGRFSGQFGRVCPPRECL